MNKKKNSKAEQPKGLNLLDGVPSLSIIKEARRYDLRRAEIEGSFLDELISLIDISKNKDLFIGFNFLPDGDRVIEVDIDIKENLMLSLEREELIKIIDFKIDPEILEIEIYGCFFSVVDPAITKKLKEKKMSLNLDGIQKIDVLEDSAEQKKVILYINGNYDFPIELNRGIYSKNFYILSQDQEISYSKSFFDYFSSNKNNPLYKKYNLSLSRILVQDGGKVRPKIPIKLRTQKFISQQRNKKSKVA